MKLNTDPNTNPQINLVPILDSIFILIFVFMFALIQRADRRGLNLNLPQTQISQPKLNPKTITLTVDTYGQIFIENRQISKFELQGELRVISIEDPKANLTLKGDKKVNLGVFVEILDLVKKSGFRNVMIETNTTPDQRNRLVD